MASTFAHDAQGFLVGQLLAFGRNEIEADKASMAVWRGIHSDVRAIARALGVQRRGGGRQGSPVGSNAAGAGGRGTRQPAGRGGTGAARSGAGGSPGGGRGAAGAGTITGETGARQTQTTGGRGRPGRAGIPSGDGRAERDALGRFTGGAGGDGTSDKADGDETGRLTNAIEKLGLSMDSADQLDPTIAAVQEVRDAVSPLGRGLFSLFGQSAERKKDVWYKRLLKAITRRNDGAAGAGAGAGGEAVQSGSFMGTLMGELVPRVMLFMVPLLMAIGGTILAGLSLLGGVKLGQLIYKWLDDSGFMTKLFDAADSIKQAFSDAAGWLKKKYETGKDAVKNTYEAAKGAVTAAVNGTADDFKKGMKEKTDPVKPAPPTPDKTGHNINAPTKIDAKPAAELPPATSMAQRAGRVVGGIRKLLGVDGTKRMYENADGSTETRAGGSVSWRNNNPGNLKFEHAGSADSSVKSKRTKAQALKAAQARYEGVVDLDQWGNAIFTTEEAGRAAKAKLLTGAHGAKTVEEMLPKYAVSDYSGRANHKAYAAGIYKTADAQGVDLRGKKIGDLSQQEMSALLDGMKKVEGFKVGTVSPLKNIPAASVVPAMPYLRTATTVNAGVARIPPLVIPSAVPERIQPVPEAAIPTKLNSGKPAPVNVSMREPIGQDVGDRSIAHVVSGGLGKVAGG